MPTRNPSAKSCSEQMSTISQAPVHSCVLGRYPPPASPSPSHRTAIQRNPAQERKSVRQAAPTDATDSIPLASYLPPVKKTLLLFRLSPHTPRDPFLSYLICSSIRYAYHKLRHVPNPADLPGQSTTYPPSHDPRPPIITTTHSY